MVTLYKRASVRQAKLFRIIEGAVRDTANAHPDRIDKGMAASVAKRAAGTLTAEWPAVLALPIAAAPVGAVSQPSRDRRRESRRTSNDAAVSASRFHSRRTAQGRSWPRPLLSVRNVLALWLRAAECEGNVERANALGDVLRLMARNEVPE